MSWVAVGVGVGTAALGAYQQSEAQKNQQRAQSANMMANAAAMEYSPWTGMGKEMVQAAPGGSTADIAMAGLEGGMAGYKFGKQFNKPTPKPEDNPTQGMKQKKKPTLYSGIDRGYTGGMTGYDPSATT